MRQVDKDVSVQLCEFLFDERLKKRTKKVVGLEQRNTAKLEHRFMFTCL